VLSDRYGPAAVRAALEHEFERARAEAAGR